MDKIRSLMEKFAITEEEARELLGETKTILAGDDSSDDSATEDSSSDDDTEVEDTETYDVMEADVTAQMHDEGTPESKSAVNAYKKAIAQLNATRQVTSAKRNKIALDTMTPTQLQNPEGEPDDALYTQLVQENDADPAIDETAIQQAVSKVEQLGATSPNMTDEERHQHAQFFLNKSPEQATMAYLRHADKNMGAKKGKYIRSRFNPNYFKEVTSGKWYEINLEKVAAPQEGDTRMIESEEVPGGMENPIDPSTGKGINDVPAEDTSAEQGYNLGEEEKQRLSQLLTDASANGVSPYHLLGTVAGFLGDKKLQSVGSSQNETTDFQNGFREGGMARGGNQETRI